MKSSLRVITLNIYGQWWQKNNVVALKSFIIKLSACNFAWNVGKSFFNNFKYKNGHVILNTSIELAQINILPQDRLPRYCICMYNKILLITYMYAKTVAYRKCDEHTCISTKTWTYLKDMPEDKQLCRPNVYWGFFFEITRTTLWVVVHVCKQIQTNILSSLIFKYSTIIAIAKQNLLSTNNWYLWGNKERQLLLMSCFKLGDVKCAHTPITFGEKLKTTQMQFNCKASPSPLFSSI